MEKKGIIQRIAKIADLEAEPIPGKPLVEIVDANSVLIENHCGVICYSCERISIKTKKGCIIVEGSSLVLSRMSKEQLCIKGVIHRVEMHRRDK